jgi:hypothetical protein
MTRVFAVCLALAMGWLMPASASADPFSFTTGAPDGRIGLAARPDSGGLLEIESADDFILTSGTLLTGGTFTGLLPTGTSASDVVSVTAEIYRVFKKDSQDPPSGRVPTRVNSPSDVAFDSRTSSDGSLSFSTSIVDPSFTASNSIVNGINPKPNVFTGGEGAVTGQAAQFALHFTQPFSLGPDHYFFVPQVELKNGTFLWLSAAGPAAFAGDLQAWIRNSALDPDWLRAGTDIVGGGAPTAPKFNASFSLEGTAPVPEPASLTLVGMGLLLAAKRRAGRTRMAARPE